MLPFREAIDFAPKLGFNVFMIEFKFPKSYYTRYYEHDNNPHRVPEPVSFENMIQWKRDVESEITKRGLQYHDMGHGNNFYVEDSRCLRCGKCIDACPMKLMPVMMYKSLYTNDVEEMKATNIMDCIECGCCAFTCPASVPLVLGFRSAKQRIRDAAAAAKK